MDGFWTSQFFLLKRRWRSLAIAALTALAAATIARSPWTQESPDYVVGRLAGKDEVAQQDMRVIDEELTDKKRRLLSEQVLPIYDFDSATRSQLIDRVKNAKATTLGQSSATETMIEELLKVPLTSLQWVALRANRGSHILESLATQFVADYRSVWIVEEKSTLVSSEILVRDIRSNEEIRVSRKAFLNKIQSISEVRDSFRARYQTPPKQERTLSPAHYEQILFLFTNLIETDLSFNRVETEHRRQEISASIEPVVYEVRGGETFLKAGERIERRHVLLLASQQKQGDKLRGFKATGLMALFLFVLILVLNFVGQSNFKKFKLSLRDQCVIGGFLVISLGLYAFALHVLHVSRGTTSFGSAIHYLLPIAFSGMTLRLFASMEITHFFILIQAICLSLIQRDAFFGVAFYTSSLAAAACMRHISQRSDVFRAGLVAGLVVSVMMIVGSMAGLSDLPNFELPIISYTALIGFCLLSGFVSSMLVLGFQPIIELLGYTTDLRLMELASTNHPLLRDLIIKAPGTYFHSFTVSQLAEKAAETIRGNGLFARVASLYHDVGKLKKPHYFIENIKGENKHDKLAPTMSALIISNHVKEGIELALEYKLPPSIIEVIPQHHGTGLISYFYDKARKLAEAEGTEEPDDRDFRYPGPKPQTREAAIILLADAVEATVKSLPKKSADQIRQVVHQTIERFFLDGQLDECDLTLKDLNAIGMAFSQVLQGIYHQRIEYPSHKEESDDPQRTSSMKPFSP